MTTNMENTDQYKDEEWKDIPNCEGYAVSSHGRIKSKARILINRQGTKTNWPERIIKSGKRDGYFYFNARINGLQKPYRVHRLVAQMFVSNPLDKPQVNHIDGNRANNLKSNLEWVTSSENRQHAYDVLLSGALGEHRSDGKLTWAKVREIRQIGRSVPLRAIAEKYNVSRSQISLILRGEQWRPIHDRSLRICPISFPATSERASSKISES